MNQTTAKDTPEGGSAAGDKLGRLPILSGAIVALVALVSVDCVLTATTTVDRVQRTKLVAARTLAPSNASVLARVPTLSWTVSALAVLLLFGRQLILVMPRPTTADLGLPRDTTGPAMLLRSRTSISYHIGGLHGP